MRLNLRICENGCKLTTSTTSLRMWGKRGYVLNTPARQTFTIADFILEIPFSRYGLTVTYLKHPNARAMMVWNVARWILRNAPFIPWGTLCHFKGLTSSKRGFDSSCSYIVMWPGIMRFEHKSNATTCLVYSKGVKECNEEFQTFEFC